MVLPLWHSKHGWWWSPDVSWRCWRWFEEAMRWELWESPVKGWHDWVLVSKLVALLEAVHEVADHDFVFPLLLVEGINMGIDMSNNFPKVMVVHVFNIMYFISDLILNVMLDLVKLVENSSEWASCLVRPGCFSLGNHVFNLNLEAVMVEFLFSVKGVIES